MESEKYGFVYLWYDRRREMYYIGSHWGTENDGYVCSSDRMRKAYKRRPEDFKRRILSRVYTNRTVLLLVERSWLELIRQEDLGVRYYNLSTKILIKWSNGGFVSDATKEKIRQANVGKVHSEQTKQRMSNSQKNVQPFLKKVISDKHKEILSKTHSGKRLSDEHKQIISERHKGNTHRLGHTLSVEHKERIRRANTGRVCSQETRDKISIAKRKKK